jgi:hypothetical protein
MSRSPYCTLSISLDLDHVTFCGGSNHSATQSHTSMEGIMLLYFLPIKLLSVSRQGTLHAIFNVQYLSAFYFGDTWIGLAFFILKKNLCEGSSNYYVRLANPWGKATSVWFYFISFFLIYDFMLPLQPSLICTYTSITYLAVIKF